MASALSTLRSSLGKTGTKIGIKALQDPTEIGAAAQTSCTIQDTCAWGTGGCAWPAMAEENSNQLTPAIPGSKLKTARFYFARLLPRADMMNRCCFLAQKH